MLLEIDPTKLQANTTYENIGEKHPHIYGAVDKAAVGRVTRIGCNSDGLFGGVFDQKSEQPGPA